MSNTSKVILVTIIATCILLGLGYAAITNITLNIAGTASATADSGNFKVRFTDNISVSDAAYVSATRTQDTSATIEVDGLTSAGQSVTATYEIKNESSDLSADLKVATTNSNTDYFKISSQLGKSSLIANESTTVLVTVELTKTPIDADVSATVGVNLTAMPVQPGEEGTSTGTNDYSETPTTVNEYGFYYNEAYVYEISEDMTAALIFAEDGSYEVYINNEFDGYYPAGSVTYGEKTITAVGVENEDATLQVSDDGTQLSLGEVLYVLDESYIDRFDVLGKNEYGFYYGQPYSLKIEEESTEHLVTLIFNEDTSGEFYLDGKLQEVIPANTFAYEKNTIYETYETTKEVDGETVTETVTDTYTVWCDGRIIMVEGGLYFGLDLTFLEKYCLPEGYIYGMLVDELENGDLVYSWQRQLPETFKAFDIYLTPEYVYGNIHGSWQVLVSVHDLDLPSGYAPIGKDKESYGEIASTVLDYPVTSAYELFKDCTNLKTAPAIPSSINDMGKTFAGCTSLEGNVEINVVTLKNYEDCFKGVDMSKITLTGTASKEIKNLLGSTGENYTPIP